MQPLDNHPLSKRYAWHPNGWFGAREKVDISIENNHVNIQVIAQSAFAHALVRFVKFFGGKIHDDFWATVKKKESKDLTNLQINTFLRELPPESTAIAAKNLLKTIHEEILPSLARLQDHAIPGDIKQEAKGKAALLQEAVATLSATSSQIEEPSASKEPQAISPFSLSQDGSESSLSASIENIQQISLTKFPTPAPNPDLTLEIDESPVQEAIADKSPVQTALLPKVEKTIEDNSKTAEDLKATIRKIQDNALSALSELNEEETNVNKALPTHSPLLGEIQKVRSAVQDILKQVNKHNLHVDNNADLEEQIARAQALCNQTAEWIKSVNDIHAATIKISALERDLTDVLQKLEDPTLPFQDSSRSAYQIHLRELLNNLHSIATIESALDTEKKFNICKASLCQDLAEAAPAHFDNLRTEATSWLTDEAVLHARQAKWEKLKKSIPQEEANWYTLHTWYSEIRKIAAVDAALANLLKEHPGSSFADVILAATKQIGELGISIIKDIDPDKLDDEIFVDDIAPQPNEGLATMINEIQKAFITMSESQSLSINQLHEWKDNLLSLTDKSLNIYNFSIRTEQELPKACSNLGALSACIDVLIDCHNHQHDGYFNAKAKKRAAFLAEGKETPASQYFDAIMQSLRQASTWNPTLPLADLRFTPVLWERHASQAKSMASGLKQLATGYSDLQEKIQLAYEHANKAPEQSQQTLETEELDKITSKIKLNPSPNSLANPSYQNIQEFTASIQKATSRIQSAVKDIKRRNAIRQQISAAIEKALADIDGYRQKISEMEEWFGIALMPAVEARLTSIETSLEEAKSHIIPALADDSTKTWWQKITSFTAPKLTTILPMVTQAPTLSIQDLQDREKATRQLISRLKKDLRNSYQLDDLDRSFTSIKELYKRIQKQIDDLNISGQITHAQKLSKQLETIHTEHSSTYKAEISWDIALMLGNTNTYISPIDYLKRRLPQILDSLLQQNKRVAKLPYYTLLSQIPDADTKEKADHLRNALIKEAHEKIAHAQKKLQADINTACDNVDSAKLDSSLKDHLQALFHTHKRALEALKVNVSFQRGGVMGFGSNADTVAVADLSLDDTPGYHKQVEHAVQQGIDAIQFATAEIEKLETAEITYKAALAEAEERSAWLDKNNQLAARHDLQTAIDTIQDEYNKKYYSLTNKDASTANILDKPVAGWAGTVLGSFSTIAKYNRFIGKKTAALKKAAEKARNAPYHPFYPDQLNIKNLPDEIATELRERYRKYVHGEINRCVADLNRYRELAQGPLGAYIDTYSHWQIPKSRLGWLAQKLSSSDSNLSINAMIDSKIKQIEDLRLQFERESGLYNLYRPVHVAVDDHMSAAELRNYITAVQNMKSTLTASIEKETYLGTTTKYLKVLSSKLDEAKAFAKTLEDEEQWDSQKKLLDHIATIEHKMKAAEGTLCSYAGMYSFCQSMQTHIRKIQENIAESKYARRQSILEQLKAVINSSDAGLASKLLLKFIDQSKGIIAKYKEKIGSFEGMVSTLFEKGIISTNLEAALKGILAKEKFVGIAQFEKPWAVSRKSKWLGTVTTEFKPLQDLTITELEDYNEKLCTRALIFYKGSFNKECELIKIDKQTQLEALHSALYGPCYIGYNDTLERLNKLAAKVEGIYTNPGDKGKLKSKINALTTSTRFIIDTLAKEISSYDNMRIAAHATKAQVAHIITTIDSLEKQITKAKRAKKAVKDTPIIPIKLSPLPHILYLERSNPRYKANAEYLSARWEFLSGHPIAPKHMETAHSLLSAATPPDVTIFLTNAAAAATAHPDFAADILAAAARNPVALTHIPPPTVPPTPPAAILSAAAAAALLASPGVVIPAPDVKVHAALAALARMAVNRAESIGAAFIFAQGSPYANALTMTRKLNAFLATVNTALGAGGITPVQKRQLQELSAYVRTSSDLFLHFHQGIPEIQNGRIVITTPLSEMTTEANLASYIIAMQKRYTDSISAIQKQLEEIKHKTLKLPGDMHDGIQWNY